MSDSNGRHLSVEAVGDFISITVDRTTANYLRYVIEAVGEHLAAGWEIPSMPTDMANSLGSIMNEIEDRLRTY